MTLAFFRKDVRLAARAGHLVPGLTTALVLQAIGLGLIGGWSLWTGAPMAPAVVPEIPHFLAIGAFLMAIIGPANASVMAMLPELQPEIAESLASAPVRASRFFAGKCLLPMVGGAAWQLALLPSWGFLVGRGLVDPVAPLKVLAITIPLAAFSALAGISRWRTLQLVASGRMRGVGARRATPAQQVWIVLAMMFATSNVTALMGGTPLSPGTPAGNGWRRAFDFLRAFLPMAQLHRPTPVSMFSLGFPPLLVGAPLIVIAAAGALARAVASHPRALEGERVIAQRASIASRSLIVLALAGALWIEGPAEACAVAAALATLYALGGVAGVRERLVNARAAALTCVPVAAIAGLAGGFPVLLFWGAMAMLCAFFAGALPVARPDADRRPIAVGLMLLLAIAGPITSLIFSQIYGPGSPLMVGVGVLCLLSPLAAIGSLASAAISPLPEWTALVTDAPILATIPAWAVCAMVYGSVTAIAGRRKPSPAAASTMHPAGG